MFNNFIQITKPGIILGNLISVTGGFLLASKGKIDYVLFFWTIFSLSLVLASAGVFNNFIDIDIDAKMERTKHRALVNGFISPIVALGYAFFLGITGFLTLWFFGNFLSFCLGIIGFIIYVGVYSYMKRYSIHSTSIGAISGAIPPVIGYSIVTNKLDNITFILILIFILWQIPHSYSIAIFRFKDYQKANIPILPVVKGISVAKSHIIYYIIAFSIASSIPFFIGYTGHIYLITSMTTNIFWLIIALNRRKIKNDNIWAKKIFLFSIFVITVLSVMISIDFIELNYQSSNVYILKNLFN